MRAAIRVSSGCRTVIKGKRRAATANGRERRIGPVAALLESKKEAAFADGGPAGRELGGHRRLADASLARDQRRRAAKDATVTHPVTTALPEVVRTVVVDGCCKGIRSGSTSSPRPCVMTNGKAPRRIAASLTAETRAER